MRISVRQSPLDPWKKAERDRSERRKERVSLRTRGSESHSEEEVPALSFPFQKRSYSFYLIVEKIQEKKSGIIT